MAQGDSWKLGVAAPVKNHKFEFGQSQYSTLQSNITANAILIPLPTASDPQIRDKVQYNDTVLLGPSSNAANDGERETILTSGMDSGDPTGNLHSLTKNNTYLYDTGDPVMFYGTGMAGGWDIPSGVTYCEAQGINRGLISTNDWMTYTKIANDSDPAQGQFSWYNNSGDSFVRLQRSINRYGGIIDMVSSYFTNGYVIEPVDENNEAWLHVPSEPDGNKAFQHGDWHRGGWRKDQAQRLEITLDDAMSSSRFFETDLIRAGNGSVRQRAQVIPWQYYRIGGRVYFDTTKMTYTFGDGFNIYLLLMPHQYGTDYNFPEYITATVGTSGTDTDQWIEFSTVGALKGGLRETYPPKLAFWMQNNAISGASANDRLIMYIDDAYAEHAGGVNYAATDGCLDFGRYNQYIDHDSLKINYIKRTNSQSLYGKNDRLVIEGQLSFMSQDFWDALDTIMHWQFRGFPLNLHMNTNDLPHSIMGKMQLDNIVKDNWDLSLRSCTFKFIEDE
ncbi:MAG: hypothetical protein ACW96X_05335 [Promethearchaeota archaeon]|jgi:hypothetical protein